jgi:TolB-like protein/Tfp pilus assembly protein PilF
VDFDHGLNRAMNKLREALGDSAESPRFIETLARRGYRFIGPVEGARSPEPPNTTEAVVVHDPRKVAAGPTVDAARRWNKHRWALGSGIVALFMALGLLASLWLARQPRAGARTPQLQQGPSIAVLPFVDMSAGKDQQYFADGMTEELIDLLSRIPELRVPARTSSFYFKGRSEDIPTIARRLMVAHLLEGSVRKSGNHVRVTVQLIRAETGFHLWSDTFDRELDDIFKVQDDIAGAVVNSLKVSLLEAKSPRAAPAGNSAAYTLYLQARFIAAHSERPEDDQRAMSLLERALKEDPRFSRALATLALLRVGNYQYYLTGNLEQIRTRARLEAQRALELDPRLAEAHVALGAISELDWDWKSAQMEYQRAIELNPDSIAALESLAALAANRGRLDQAVRYAQMAIQKDPVSAFTYENLGNAYLTADKPAEAEAAYRQAIELSPEAAGLHLMLGWALLARGQPAAALAEMERETDAGWRAAGTALALEVLGRRSESDRALKAALELTPERSEYEIAQVYASRSDPDNALLWLERAYLRRSADISLYVRGDPVMKNLRGDRRYRAVLRKMKLLE